MADYPIERALAHLNQTGLARTSNSLYQTIKELINASRSNQETINQSSVVINQTIVSNANATYVTSTNQTAVLPNSRALTAGSNVTLDTATPGELIINVPNAPLIAEVTLTDAQIKALPTTGGIVVPAPVAGNYYRLVDVDYEITIVSPYTNIDPTYADLHASYSSVAYAGGYIPDDPTTSPALTKFTEFFTTVGSYVFPSPQYLEGYPGSVLYPTYVIGNGPLNVTLVDGMPLTVDIYNGLGNLTGGNVGNSLKVRYYYYEYTL